MTLQEVYLYYDKCWAKTCRELKLSPNAYQNWIRLGYLPIKTQVHIEKVSQGKFKADLKHLESEKWIKN